jgi:hypothetical protein
MKTILISIALIGLYSCNKCETCKTTTTVTYYPSLMGTEKTEHLYEVCDKKALKALDNKSQVTTTYVDDIMVVRIDKTECSRK